MNEIEAKEIERKYISKCHNAEIEVMESEMPDSGSRMQKHFGYRCTKCSESCEIKCLHKKTVAINEEGHAGIFCTDCGEQLSKEC